jgi:hypothetical protein
MTTHTTCHPNCPRVNPVYTVHDPLILKVPKDTIDVIRYVMDHWTYQGHIPNEKTIIEI